MLCSTCPWDRHCILPPSMTRAEIDAEQEKMKREDEAKRRENPAEAGLPVGLLLGTIMYAGKDTAAQVCPVFALRMRTADGEALARSIKGDQQAWAERDGAVA